MCGCGSGPAPAWDWVRELERPDGAKLESATSPDKPVLLVFFSSWALPCVPMLDALPALADRARVIAVRCDSDQSQAADRPGVEVATSPDMKIAGRFNVTTLPTAVLLDRLGRQVERLEGYSPAVCSLLGARLDSLTAHP